MKDNITKITVYQEGNASLAEDIINVFKNPKRGRKEKGLLDSKYDYIEIFIKKGRL